MVSSYTEVSVTGGSTITIITQTIVEAPTTPKVHTLSRDVLAGVVVSGALLLLLFVGISLWWLRRHRRLRSQKDAEGEDSSTLCLLDSLQCFTDGGPFHITEPNTMAGIVAPLTKGMHPSGRPAAETSRSPVATISSQRNLTPSHRDSTLPPAESDEEGSSGSELSDLTAPYLSSAIAEASLILDDGPSGTPTENDSQAIALTHLQMKPDSESTMPPSIRLQLSLPQATQRAAGEPERSERDGATVASGGDGSIPRAGARLRRLWIEEDSGVRLAGGRVGYTRGEPEEETGSGEWEVLPPPYREF